MPIRVTQRRERQLGYVCDLVYGTLGLPLVPDAIPLKGVGGDYASWWWLIQPVAVFLSPRPSCYALYTLAS